MDNALKNQDFIPGFVVCRTEHVKRKSSTITPNRESKVLRTEAGGSGSQPNSNHTQRSEASESHIIKLKLGPGSSSTLRSGRSGPEEMEVGRLPDGHSSRPPSLQPSSSSRHAVSSVPSHLRNRAPTPVTSPIATRPRTAATDTATFQPSVQVGTTASFRLRASVSSAVGTARLSTGVSALNDSRTASSSASSSASPVVESVSIEAGNISEESAQNRIVVLGKMKRNPILIPAHISTLTGEPLLYQCVCMKKFKTKANIKYHEFCQNQNGEKPFKCEQCGQGFIAKSHYEYHLRTHTGERPYVCPTCGKGFNQRGKLTRHERSHTGEKPFVCQQCGRGFANSQAMRSHCLTHTGERPFACEYCDKRFTGMTNLKKHIITHTGERPFMCTDCGKSFGFKCTLDLHIRTHSSERHYTCDKCSKAFTNSKNLVRHKLIHSGEFPFECSICGTAFRRKDNLEQHLKDKHHQPKEVAKQLANEAAAQSHGSTKRSTASNSTSVLTTSIPKPSNHGKLSTQTPVPSTSKSASPSMGGSATRPSRSNKPTSTRLLVLNKQSSTRSTSSSASNSATYSTEAKRATSSKATVLQKNSILKSKSSPSKTNGGPGASASKNSSRIAQMSSSTPVTERDSETETPRRSFLNKPQRTASNAVIITAEVSPASSPVSTHHDTEDTGRTSFIHENSQFPDTCGISAGDATSILDIPKEALLDFNFLKDAEFSAEVYMEPTLALEIPAELWPSDQGESPLSTVRTPSPSVQPKEDAEDRETPPLGEQESPLSATQSPSSGVDAEEPVDNTYADTEEHIEESEALVTDCEGSTPSSTAQSPTQTGLAEDHSEDEEGETGTVDDKGTLLSTCVRSPSIEDEAEEPVEESQTQPKCEWESRLSAGLSPIPAEDTEENSAFSQALPMDVESPLSTVQTPSQLVQPIHSLDQIPFLTLVIGDQSPTRTLVTEDHYEDEDGQTGQADEEYSMPDLGNITPEMRQTIINATYGQEDMVIVTAFNKQITRRDLRTLAPAHWLNDNVIDIYLDMIALRSKNSLGMFPTVHAFTTFFYPKFVKEGYSNRLKRWTRKVDILSMDMLIFPIHREKHWCLAVADLRENSIKLYDSLLGQDMECLEALLSYLSSELKERKKEELNRAEWSLQLMKEIPTQENGSDCGVFTCKFAECLSRDANLSFTQEDVNYYRYLMIYEIATMQLFQVQQV